MLFCRYVSKDATFVQEVLHSFANAFRAGFLGADIGFESELFLQVVPRCWANCNDDISCSAVWLRVDFPWRSSPVLPFLCELVLTVNAFQTSQHGLAAARTEHYHNNKGTQSVRIDPGYLRRKILCERFHDARIVDNELVDADLLVFRQSRIHEGLRDDVTALFANEEKKWEGFLGPDEGMVVLEDVLGKIFAAAGV